MTKITVRDNGPLRVEGDDFSVCDASGGVFLVSGSNIVLCRCGGSAKKPFCDGAHGRIGFRAADRAGSSSS